jgi:hypothetical protein
MTATHKKLPLHLDVHLLKKALEKNSDLFGKYPYRGEAPGSPHSEMTDIWVRYNDIKPYLESGDFTEFANEHDSVWYDAYYRLPEVKKPIFDVMNAVNGERLGGVLITKLPPGGKITKHVDGGWHAAYYDKYYVAIKNSYGAKFCFEDGVIDPREGDVYWFDNSKPHWVENNTDDDRIAMIICIKIDRKAEV